MFVQIVTFRETDLFGLIHGLQMSHTIGRSHVCDSVRKVFRTYYDIRERIASKVVLFRANWVRQDEKWYATMVSSGWELLGLRWKLMVKNKCP